jgi:hypothetical protein
MENLQMSSEEAIKKIESAIENGDKKAMLELVAPDDLDTLPDWDSEPDYLWEDWENLVDKANSLLGI